MLLSKYNYPVICNYNPSKFGAHVALEIVRAHPLVIIGGLLQENPFFVPPTNSSMGCVNDDQLAKRRHGEVLKWR